MDRREPPRAVRWRTRVELALATGCGAGRVPFAPGTAGAALGLGIAAGLVRLGGSSALLAGTLVVGALGLWCAGAAARQLGATDPGAIVVDEIAGQMLALLLVPPTATAWLTSFLLFRLLDVTKPFPARRLEALPGASGIMADDLVAAVYANLLTQLACGLAPERWGVA